MEYGFVLPSPMMSGTSHQCAAWPQGSQQGTCPSLHSLLPDKQRQRDALRNKLGSWKLYPGALTPGQTRRKLIKGELHSKELLLLKC